MPTTLDVRRILAPIDFSRGSDESARVAVELAARLGASVALLHVFPPSEGMGYVPNEVELAAETARLEASLADAAKRLGNAVVIVTHLVRGEPWREIVDCVSRENSQLVVMGTQGRSGLPQLFMGSVAERVVRRSPVPVLVVPRRRA
jgi:nucleotide-binding universal stress UspA family protein